MSNVTRLVPGGSSVTRAAPDGRTVTTAFPGGATVTRAAPSGRTVTRLSPPGAAEGGGESDGFLEACKEQESLYGVWTCKDLDPGDLENGNTVMTDLSGNDRPVINVVLEATGNWQVEHENGPGGDSSSLTKWVSTDEDDQGDSPQNFAALASTIAPVDSDTQDSSGFVIFKMPELWQRFEIAHYSGTTGTPTGYSGTKPLLLNTYLTTIQAANSDGGTNFGIGTSGSSTTTQAGNWCFWGWRLVWGGSTFTFYSYIQRCGSDWGTNQTTWNQGQGGSLATVKTGLRFGYGSTEANTVAGSGWAAHAIFSADIGSDGLQKIYAESGLAG